MYSALSGLLEFSPVLLRYFISGGNFTLAELGVCEPTPPPHTNAVPYCPDLALLQRGYSLSAGSDADSDPEGPLSPERAIQLWAGQGRVKSRRSSGVSSRENSALTLTDSENDNKSDDDVKPAQYFAEVSMEGQQNAIERSFASNSRPYEMSFLILCYIAIIVCLHAGNSANAAPVDQIQATLIELDWWGPPRPPLSPQAYVDDEEDEDPFGDYVISKSRLTLASLRLLGPTLGFCVIVFDVLLCPLLHLSVRDLRCCL
ncbi:hypothetical protein JOQ06_023132 [Pogonophryne albipinna]|uniref:Teneurin N-terminal domain-containing protein n=1 Tax=Pogonophryne albipinna TaxID=1090488 RepID=A0AAD6BMB6_9TELE|nr:hypothetical protein JOQ06_023132 [Pogonophryne albipinna]